MILNTGVTDMKDFYIPKRDFTINSINSAFVKTRDTDFYFNHTENLKIADKTGEYIVGDVTVYCNIKNRQIQCVADVYGTTIGFNHNKADLSGLGLDFYFFGADTPRNVDADNYFYFYPVNKKNVDLVTEKQAVELYDIIEIKIRKTNGEYSIIEDVKNFGSRI